jgi:two-component system NarL family sensor kinase
MSAVAMQIYGLRKRLASPAGAPPPQTLARDLETIEEVVAAGLEETRRFVWNLREPPAAEGMPAALSKLAQRMTVGADVEARVEVEGPVRRLSSDVETELLRIAQEAVSNAVKHAQAHHIVLRLCYEGDAVKLSVSDDGRGFDPDQVPAGRAGHFGLVGMQERAARLGTLEIRSRPGEGTEVTVSVSAETARHEVDSKDAESKEAEPNDD